MSDTETPQAQENMTFFEHIDALRKPLLRSVIAVFLFSIVAFVFSKYLFNYIIFAPQSADFPSSRLLNYISNLVGAGDIVLTKPEFSFVNTSMSGQLQLDLKISVLTGLCIGVPYVLAELWHFVMPALTQKERRATRSLVFYVSLCFFSGLLFGYFIIAPLAVNFLLNYSLSPLIVNMIDVNSYLSIIINVTLASAVLFQLPLLVWLLASMGIVTDKFMRRYRRHAIFVLAIFAAVITPPDVVSQVLVLIPLLVLYELSIGIARRVCERKLQEE